MRRDSGVSVEEMVEEVSKSRRTVSRAISVLKEEGSIRRIGPNRGGHWETCGNARRR